MMKPNSIAILNYVKEANGANITTADIADATGIAKKSVEGSVTALCKKELMVREPAQIKLEDGTLKDIKFVKITEAGKTFDPTATAQAE